MPELFEVQELVKVAVEDEKSGVAFYTVASQQASDAELKGTFSDLANQERYHQRRFEKMLQELGGLKTPETYPGEYQSYIKALTDSRAFPDEQTAERMARQCADDLAAVNLALRFERDTLMLMNEMRALVSEKHRPVVDELANEEKSHLVVLTAAKERLGS